MVVHDILHLAHVHSLLRTGVVVILDAAGGTIGLHEGEAQPLAHVAGGRDTVVSAGSEILACRLEHQAIILRGAHDHVGPAFVLHDLGTGVDQVRLDGILRDGRRCSGRLTLLGQRGDAALHPALPALLDSGGQILVARREAHRRGLDAIDLLGLLEVVVDLNGDQRISGHLVSEVPAGGASLHGAGVELVDEDLAGGASLVLVGAGHTGHQNRVKIQVGLQDGGIPLVHMETVISDRHLSYSFTLFSCRTGCLHRSHPDPRPLPGFGGSGCRA